MDKLLLFVSYLAALIAVLVAIDISIKGSDMVWITLVFNVVAILCLSLSYFFEGQFGIFFRAISWSFFVSLLINIGIFSEKVLQSYGGGDAQGGDIILAISVFFLQPIVFIILLIFFKNRRTSL